MKVEEPPPIQSTRKVGSEQSVPPADAAGESRDDRHAPRDERELPHDVQDVAAVHGVGEREMTPSVREAMEELIAEVAALREALEQNRKRLEYLTMLADQDSVSQVLNRRAFARELSRALAIAQRRGADSSLLFVEIDNLKSINERLGLAAGDAAIEHVAAIIRSQTPDGDVVGRVGGAEFGIILIGEQEDQAQQRAETISATIAARPLIWRDAEVPLALIWGTHPLHDGEDASAAMNAADRRLRVVGAESHSE